MRNNKGNLICKFRHSLGTFSNSVHFGGLSNICHCIFVLLAAAAIIFTVAETGMALNSNDSQENAGPIIDATNVFLNTEWIYFTANELPMFYLDLDLEFDPDNNQGESLTIHLNDESEIAEDGLIYTSRAWVDEYGRMNIAWLGEKYLAVGDDVTKLSKYLVDFKPNENLTLELGDVWDMGEGYTLKFQDIDVNGEQAWFVFKKDGNPVEDIIASPEGVAGSLGGWGYYNDTLTGEYDVTIVMIHVDTIFEDKIIIDDAQVISLDVTELNQDKYYGLEFTNTANTLQLEEQDGTTSIDRGKRVEIIPDFLSIKVGDTQSDEPVRFYVFSEITPQELYKQHGPIINSTAEAPGSIILDANDLPMFYKDLDAIYFNPENNKGESLTINLISVDTIADNGIIYTSRAWNDANGRMNIAWLGEKYLAVGDDVSKLSKYLVDFQSDDNITLKQGDVWDIEEGLTLVVQDIDVNGEQVWMVLEQDGSPIEDIIASPEGVAGSLGGWGYYNDTLAGESDVVIARIHVDKVFEGMFESIVIIDNAEIISLNVTELNMDEYFGMDFDTTADMIRLTEGDGSTNISLGKTVEIIPDFLNIKVSDTLLDRFYVYREDAPDTIPPVITNIANNTPTTDSVTLTWYTDEDSDSRVKYGNISGNYTMQEFNTTMVTAHSITVTGLNLDTTYYFVVNSTDASGNAGQSSEYSFMTAAAADTIPPVITNIANNTPTNDSVTLTWYTDEDSDSLVKYGDMAGNYTMQEFNTTLVTAHSITLTGLTPDSTYYFVVNSTDASGNAGEGSEYSFTTASTSDTTTIIIGDAIAAPNGYAFTSIMVKNVTDLGSGDVDITFDPSVIQVIDVTSGDGNALTVQDMDINNTAGLVQITAWDAEKSHNGDVVFALVTLHSIGDHLSSTALAISSAELTNYDTFEPITHTVANGTLDTIAPVVIIDNVEAASGEFTTALVTVNNASNLGSGSITVTYNSSVVHVTNVTSGDGNALAVQGWNVDNTTGSVQILAQDGTISHNGDVVLAIVTFHAVGEYPDSTPLAISSSELVDYTRYGVIGHSVTNGTFSIIDNEPPVITDAIATPDPILNDNGRPRVPGTNVTVLNATVLDSESGVVNVTINLSSIGGSDNQVMERIAGTDVWTVATTATDGINLTHELVVTARDGANNTNTSVIGLIVLLRGDVVRDGDLNSADALYIAKYLVGKEPMPSLLVSDMFPAEGDGKINSADALYLAKYLVGKEATP